MQQINNNHKVELNNYINDFLQDPTELLWMVNFRNLFTLAKPYFNKINLQHNITRDYFNKNRDEYMSKYLTEALAPVLSKPSGFIFKDDFDRLNLATMLSTFIDGYANPNAFVRRKLDRPKNESEFQTNRNYKSKQEQEIIAIVDALTQDEKDFVKRGGIVNNETPSANIAELLKSTYTKHDDLMLTAIFDKRKESQGRSSLYGYSLSRELNDIPYIKDNLVNRMDTIIDLFRLYHKFSLEASNVDNNLINLEPQERHDYTMEIIKKSAREFYISQGVSEKEIDIRLNMIDAAQQTTINKEYIEKHRNSLTPILYEDPYAVYNMDDLSKELQRQSNIKKAKGENDSLLDPFNYSLLSNVITLYYKGKCYRGSKKEYQNILKSFNGNDHNQQR